MLLALVASVAATSACVATAPAQGTPPPAPTSLSAATAFATPTPLSAVPLESGCAQEGSIKSPASLNVATITFDNQSRQDVKVYWLDFSGARVFYRDLKVGARYDQPTWVGHVWVVADTSGKCVRLHSANAVRQDLVIN
jgi:hypothetical protein